MDCPTCLRQMWSVEYRLTPCDYDGVSEWVCEACRLRVGRWSGRILHDGELEPRYGLDSPYRTGVTWGAVEQAVVGDSSKEMPQSPAGLFGEDLED